MQEAALTRKPLAFMICAGSAAVIAFGRGEGGVILWALSMASRRIVAARSFFRRLIAAETPPSGSFKQRAPQSTREQR